MASSTTRLRNSGDPVTIGGPDSDPNSKYVGADDVIEVDGDCTEIDDAYVIGDAEQARAWPKSRWTLVSQPSPAPTPAPSNVPTEAPKGE